MPSLYDLAVEHQAARTRVAESATRRALLWWRRINPQELDAGWLKYGRRLVEEAVAAQVAAAGQAQAYTDRIADMSGSAHGAPVVAEAFGGVQLDGRELAPAVYGAVVTTKRATSAVGATRAFEIGASYLATVLGTAIQDMGRQADLVSSVGKGWTRYVRVLSPGACSRCAVLAGKGSAAEAFRRHPRCRCTAAPIPGSGRGKTPAGFFGSGSDYFESLSEQEQDRRFTTAGAEAIRQGADISQVVNARRGAYGIGYSGHYNVPVQANRLQPVTIGTKVDGSPLRVYATTEATTARGVYGSRSTSIRLMPEQIAVMADGDPDRWVELLRRFGYIY